MITRSPLDSKSDDCDTSLRRLHVRGIGMDFSRNPHSFGSSPELLEGGLRSSKLKADALYYICSRFFSCSGIDIHVVNQ